MALCCINGVCIPYSALIPLIVVGLQWIVKKLSKAGLIPEAWSKALQRYGNSSTSGCQQQRVRRGKQCKSTTCCANVVECKTEEEWKSLWCSMTASVLVLKFTAEWCKPCKAIQPHFAALSMQSERHSMQLATVDVDELDTVAGEYSVVQMPTFVAVDVETRKTIGTPYSGSDPQKLQQWWETVQKKFA